jgi:hypothetical protein
VASNHCVVVTATLVDPRTTPALSENSTKIRLFAGSNGIEPVALPKIPKVGVWFGPIVVVVLTAWVLRQAPLAGSVWEIFSASGNCADPVLALAVMLAV